MKPIVLRQRPPARMGGEVKPPTPMEIDAVCVEIIRVAPPELSDDPVYHHAIANALHWAITGNIHGAPGAIVQAVERLEARRRAQRVDQYVCEIWRASTFWRPTVKPACRVATPRKAR